MKTDAAALISPLIEDFHQLSYIIDHLKQESFGGPDAWLSEINRATELRDKAVELIRREGDPELTGARVKVAVIGDFNAGKSSFINSLLGEALCPVQARPTTSSITTFKYGDTEAIYLLKSAADDKYSGPSRILIERDEYERKVCHEGSKGQRYEFEVYYPFSGFRDIELYDTPGFGNAQNSDDERITLEKCEAADAIFFIFDINRGNLGADMRQRLDKIKQDNPRIRIFAILNKSDQKSDPDVIEELCETWRDEKMFNVVIVYSAKKEIQKFQEKPINLHSFIDCLNFTTTSWIIRHKQGKYYYKSAVLAPSPQREDVMRQINKIQRRKTIILNRNYLKEKEIYIEQYRNLFINVLGKVNSNIKETTHSKIENQINIIKSKLTSKEKSIEHMLDDAVHFSICKRKLSNKEKSYYFSPYWEAKFNLEIFKRRINESNTGRLIENIIKDFIKEIPNESLEHIENQAAELWSIAENPSEIFEKISNHIGRNFNPTKIFEDSDEILPLIDKYKCYAIEAAKETMQERLLKPLDYLAILLEQHHLFESKLTTSKEQHSKEFLSKIEEFLEIINSREASLILEE